MVNTNNIWRGKLYILLLFGSAFRVFTVDSPEENRGKTGTVTGPEPAGYRGEKLVLSRVGENLYTATLN